MKKIYEGSVKSLYEVSFHEFDGPKESEENKVLLFSFSDAYSIFDFGRMPDIIPHKGESLAKMTSSFFEFLRNNHPHIPTHYLKRGPETNSFYARKFPSFSFKDGEYYLSPKTSNYLLPLEVLFRFQLNEKGEARKRASERGGKEKVMEDSASPLIEFSSKLEEGDRYLGLNEAQQIARLDKETFNSLIYRAREIANILKSEFSQLGLNLEDGKFEFALMEGEIVLSDSLGPDEIRLELGNVPLSKEALRRYYRERTEWGQTLVGTPPVLPGALLIVVSKMYQLLARIFECPRDEHLPNELRKLSQNLKEALSAEGVKL